jgi:hypothetical protein
MTLVRRSQKPPVSATETPSSRIIAPAETPSPTAWAVSDNPKDTFS